MANKKLEKISKTELVSGLIGMLCPIPIIGEAFLSRFLYQPVKSTGFFGESMPSNLLASACVAGLIRFQAYQPVYIPVINYVSKIFN
ncbi:MAG: hypothetical protein WC979_05565 [Candidatus Pacearchaeota archaeon]|jgi:hypothetical protein